MSGDGSKPPRGPATDLIHIGGQRIHPTVNPPIERGSTLMHTSRNAMYKDGARTYGRMGLAVHRELEDGLCKLENASSARLTANGLSACALAIASVVKAGDHLLFSDSIYGPTRRFCERRLKLMGVETTRFDPSIGSEIADLVRDNTVAIMLEAPGSLTFEICDTPAIVAVAKARGLTTIMDNTWSAGVFYKPLDHGVDISVQALTKYVVGHADAFGGAVMTRQKGMTAKIAAAAEDWGSSLGPDDAYACLRGLRTLHTRLPAHQASGLAIAQWLQAHPSVARVLHPALPDAPGHDRWRRDYTGACGLFGAILTPQSDEDLDAFLSRMTLFGMGFSWGGFESLLIPCDDQLNRMAGSWTEQREGPLLRIHAGLEDVGDLIADLQQAMSVLAHS